MLALALLTLITLLATGNSSAASATPGPATIGSDGFARFVVSPDAGAAQVLVEIEYPGLDATDAVVRLENADQTMTTTAFGVSAIVPANGTAQNFAVALLINANPDIAVTVVDGGGTVLSSTSYTLTMVDYRTLPQGQPISGWLAATGPLLPYLAVAIFAGISVLLGITLRARRRKAAEL